MAANVATSTGNSPRADKFCGTDGRVMLTVQSTDGFAVHMHARNAAEWQALRAALLAAIEEPPA